MGDRIGVLFAVLWMAVGFVAVRWIAGRYFTQPRRATVVAGAVVIAFAAGALWPYSDHGKLAAVPPASVSAVPAAAPVPAVPVAPPKDVSAMCRSVHIEHGKTRAVIDVVGVVHAGQEKPMPARFTADPADSLLVEGWAADPAAAKPATAVCLVIDGSVSVRAVALYGSMRPDVAAALGSTDLAKTGYHLQIPIHALPKGQHHIGVAVVASGGNIGIVESPSQFQTP